MTSLIKKALPQIPRKCKFLNTQENQPTEKMPHPVCIFKSKSNTQSNDIFLPSLSAL